MVKILNRYCTPIIILILLTACGSTDTGIRKENGHFLWEVRKGEGKAYLLGSIHMAKEDLYPLPGIIDSAFNESDILAVEVNVNEVNPLQIMKYATYQDTSTLKGNVKSEIYEKFREMFKNYNIPETAYNKFKPWFATMTLLSMELVKSGFKQDLGIDMHFLKKAKEENKEIKELESFEEQMQLFDKDLAKYQDIFLEYSLADFDMTLTLVDSMMQAWKTGDTEMMERITMEEMKKYPQFKPVTDIIIDKRNFEMVEKIKSYLKSGKTHFVIVGAGHLIGKNGIVNLLREEGYSIEQK